MHIVSNMLCHCLQLLCSEKSQTPMNLRYLVHAFLYTEEKRCALSLAAPALLLMLALWPWNLIGSITSPFYFFLIFLKIYFFIVIQLQLSVFSPHPSTPPQPMPPPSPTSTLPLDFVLLSFIVAPIHPSPHYPLPTPL